MIRKFINTVLQRAVSRLRASVVKMAVRISELILPAGYYVQELPYPARRLGMNPEWKTRIPEFNARKDKTPRDGVRWFMLKWLMQEVAVLKEGDIAELGTYQGKTARILFETLPKNASLYCFDTFTGFDQRDIAEERKFSGIDAVVGGFGNTCLELVTKYILGHDSDNPNLIMRVGFFPETFVGLEDVRWRLVHLDCDLVQPMRVALDLFWPRLVPGGIIIVHDYNGYFAKGLQPIVGSFCRAQGIVPIPFCDSGGSVILAKGGPVNIQK